MPPKDVQIPDLDPSKRVVAADRLRCDGNGYDARTTRGVRAEPAQLGAARHMTVHAIDVAVKAVPAPQDVGDKSKGGGPCGPPPQTPKGRPWGARNYAQIMFDVPAAGCSSGARVASPVYVAVTVKLTAVPAVVQVTWPDPVKPGSAVQAPERTCCCPRRTLPRGGRVAASAAAARGSRGAVRRDCGIAIAARIPMIATTRAARSA